ncbi:MAG: hypothetical protein J7502_10115 [Flavisolibacter sp.]|nr:hypothetical protein [Flavisolibacter sp.]
MSSQLQNKLLHYEVQPPEGVWNKIAASIEENFSPSLSEKLHEYEQAPPSGVWQNIVSQLDTPTVEETKVVPFYIRYRRPLKYSGAVAIFIFLAVLTSLLISKKTESEFPAEGIVQNNAVKNNSPKAFSSSDADDSFKEKKDSNPGRLIAKSKASKRQQEGTKRSLSFAENLLPRQAERNEMVHTSIDADKYMIYSDEDGNVVRLPKKIFSAFACPTEDLICRQRLQQLREKFAASATTADFTGLLQILKSLQENQ